MSNQFYNLAIDSRGSVNLPATIKRAWGLDTGSPIALISVGECFLLVPYTEDLQRASDAGALDSWVKQKLELPATSPAFVSKTVVAETVKLQASRERFEQRKAILSMQMQLADQKRRMLEEQRMAHRYGHNPKPWEAPPQAAVPQPAASKDFLADLRRQQEEDGKRKLEAAIRQAEQDMAAPSAGLPQAEG